MSFFHGKRIVVTGAAGFIGSHIVRLLRNSECEIVRVLRSPAARITKPGRSRIRDVTGDVREARTWKAALPGADVVFHLAAQTSGSVAEANPSADFAQNVLPMELLVGECRRRRPAIVFASTVTIAGLAEQRRVNEAVPDHPITVYDRHKQMAEECLKGYARGVSLRLSNVYGPGPISRHADRSVLNAMIARALAGKPLVVYGTGERIRDYVFVDDVAKAFLAAARSADRVGGRHFVIGTGRAHTLEHAVGRVASRVQALTGVVAAVGHAASLRLPPIDARSYVADARRFRAAARWKARVPFSAGIDRTIESVWRTLTVPAGASVR